MNGNGTFSQCISVPEADLDLAHACLLIAQSEYPKLDVNAYLGQLDNLAAAVAMRLGSDKSPQSTLAAINQTLFEDQGFTGNSENYYDPCNSFLNHVLDRRLGIPISLSIIYMEIAHRLGLVLQGVSFPGHFLVKLPLPGGDIVIDPFFSGVTLNDLELMNRIVTLFGSYPADLDLQNIMTGVGKKAILARMLRNLKNIYMQKGDYHRALSMSNNLMIVTPTSATEIRDRGVILEYLECTNAALYDYQQYLELAPNAQDQQIIRGRMLALHHAMPTVH
jgi:regulator of sirC expression with transglutaminase-like and TPR domain